MTKYHVLHWKTLDAPEQAVEAWVEVGVYEAASDTAAKKKAAEQLQLEGTFVAVPERNFKPEPFHVETTTHIVSGKPKGKKKKAASAASA